MVWWHLCVMMSRISATDVHIYILYIRRTRSLCVICALGGCCRVVSIWIHRYKWQNTAWPLALSDSDSSGGALMMTTINARRKMNQWPKFLCIYASPRHQLVLARSHSFSISWHIKCVTVRVTPRALRNIFISRRIVRKCDEVVRSESAGRLIAAWC